MSSTDTELSCAVGDVIDGRYRIDAIRASGGMGTVFHATHLLLARPVALKVISTKVLKLPGVAARFLREARLATQLESHHIVKVFDVGVLKNGAPYLVMEWLEGRDLSQILARSGPLPIETAIDYVLQACEALAEVHSRGIVHRDLKPSNLFVTRGRDGLPDVKLIDFGVSKIELSGELASARITQTGTALGSPSYMSPEQMSGAEDADERTDVWGLGVVLFELLTQALPFGGGALRDILSCIILEPPPDPVALRPSIPAGLARVMMRCLRPDPAERYPNVEALAHALVEFGGSESAARLPRIVEVARAARRTPLPTEVICGGQDLSEVVLDKSEQPLPVALTVVPGKKNSKKMSRWLLLAVAGIAASVSLFAEFSRPHAFGESAATAAPITPLAPVEDEVVSVATVTIPADTAPRTTAKTQTPAPRTVPPPPPAASALSEAPALPVVDHAPVAADPWSTPDQSALKPAEKPPSRELVQ